MRRFAAPAPSGDHGGPTQRRVTTESDITNKGCESAGTGTDNSVPLLRKGSLTWQMMTGQ
jgi:hypothetical protein